ncbi:MAG: DUF4488 domain-containing protein [Prevotellaceae bacterium]|nr:DUF4488 domain-containing protein [Prevotellaceae bacterium]MDY3364898.1 DUF4488 domain-containing protein [Prevotella sp.]
MKKKLLTLGFLVVTAIATATAQTEAKKPALNGIWQLCGSFNRVTQSVKMMPIFKILTTDHRFYNMRTSGNGPAQVTATGKYVEKSDSTYAEEFDYFAFDNTLQGKQNIITYEFTEGGKVLLLKFKVDEKSLETVEMWMRVPLMRMPSREGMGSGKPGQGSL